MFKQKEKMDWPWDEKNMSKNKPLKGQSHRSSPLKPNKVIILVLILAVIILLIAVGLLYKNNTQLKENINTTSSRPTLTNVPSGTTYKGEPIDWEGGQPVDYFACQIDEDCIKVVKSDCPCPTHSSYNLYTAINKKYEERWQVRLDSYYDICSIASVRLPGQTEKDVLENLAANCREDSVARCVNGECKIVIE